MTGATTYKTRQVGALNTLEHRTYIEDAATGVVVSPFHDIPLYANAEKTVLNMIVEIPRWSNAKLEVTKEEPFNPIKQDTKKGKLRFVRNLFPHKGYIWNYGAFPQTWEDPTVSHPDTNAVGDKDPVDVIEIGETVASIGEVKQVKVLGVMALLDEGETDWKVFAIDVKDPLASQLNDIQDVEKLLPGLVDATRHWFSDYKLADGKPKNAFAFNGAAKDKAYAMGVVTETHEAWERLITGKVPNKLADKYEIDTTNTTVSGSQYKVAASDAKVKAVPAAKVLPAAPVDPSIDKWFFFGNAKI